jgi:hypothetical protein
LTIVRGRDRKQGIKLHDWKEREEESSLHELCSTGVPCVGDLIRQHTAAMSNEAREFVCPRKTIHKNAVKEKIRPIPDEVAAATQMLRDKVDGRRRPGTCYR